MRKPIAYVAVVVVLALLPWLFGSQANYCAGVFTIVALYAVLAVSADLLVGVAGQISLGHAAFFAIGAYVSAVTTTRYGLPPLVGVAAGLVIASLLAFVIGMAVLRLRGYYLAMATLGLTAVVYTILIGWRGMTGGAAGLGGIPRFSVAGFSFDQPIGYYWLVLVVATAVVALAKELVNSAYGRALIAIHGDERTATALGINVPRYKVSVFVLSSVLAALAGSLFAHQLRFIAPDDFTIGVSVHILVMAFLGGIGTIYGAVLGAALLELLPEFVNQLRDYELLGTGLILIVVLAFFPRGIMGLIDFVHARWFRSAVVGSQREAVRG